MKSWLLQAVQETQKYYKLFLLPLVISWRGKVSRWRPLQETTMEVKSCGAPYQWMQLQNTPTLEARGNCGRGDRENVKANRVCCGIVYYTHKVSPTRLPKCELNKDDTNEHGKVDAENPTRNQPYTRTIGNWGKLGVKEVVLSREEHTNWFFPVLNGHPWKHIYK